MAAGFRARRFHADHARELANKAIREPDRAEAWSMRMEGYGGLGQQPSLRSNNLAQN